jgi:nitrite reductase (NADH) large subunit
MTLCAHLSISEAGRPDRTIAVQGVATIGRDNEEDIVLESITVSRCHAMLLPNAAEMSLIDLQSTNGTLVNGVFVPPDTLVRLADGDVIQFGQVVARYVAAPAVPAPFHDSAAPPKRARRTTGRQEAPRLAAM